MHANMLEFARRDLNCGLVYLKSLQYLHPLLVMNVIVVCCMLAAIKPLSELIVLVAGPLVPIDGSIGFI